MSHAGISVAMATCEGARFVEAQLESFALQTRPPDELVVCDDASADDTADRIEAFARSAPFAVQVHRNAQRLGTTRNFERAISLCQGDLIFLADQDDVWLPEKIAALAEVLETRPSVGAVFCDGEVVSESLAPRGYTLWDSLGFGARERARVRGGDAVGVFLRHVVAAGTTLAFRSVWRDLALPFPDLQSCHDAFTAFVIAAAGSVEIVERPLIRYRLHPGNQIGIRRLGFRGRLAKAREQVAYGAFGYAADFFGTARERLAPRADVSKRDLAALDECIRHARAREAMSGGLAGRLGAIAREAAARRYWRYGYGLGSIAQDLWLRG